MANTNFINVCYKYLVRLRGSQNSKFKIQALLIGKALKIL